MRDCIYLLPINTFSDSPQERDVCSNCPYPKCIHDLKTPPTPALTQDLLVQCRRCLSIETITLVNSKLSSSHWSFSNNHFFHSDGGLASILSSSSPSNTFL